MEDIERYEVLVDFGDWNDRWADRGKGRWRSEDGKVAKRKRGFEESGEGKKKKRVR